MDIGIIPNEAGDRLAKITKNLNLGSYTKTTDNDSNSFTKFRLRENII